MNARFWPFPGQFEGKLVDITHENDVALRFLEPGKPNQNAYVEPLNGRLRDECLNEHWFTTPADARVLIEAWRRNYNEHRLKKDWGGIPPVGYAARLDTMTASTTARR